VQQQIAELQAAVSENAALVKELAEQLQLTVTALEQAAAITQERVRRLYAISVAAMLVALVALLVAVMALMQP
jgi:bacteriorhodopsin